MSRRTLKQWRALNPRRQNDANKFGLPPNMIPWRRLERRRAAAKAARRARRSRRQVAS